MTNLFNRVSLYFKTNKIAYKNALLSVLLFCVIVLNSGYTVTYLQQDTFVKTLISLVSFLIVGFIFIITVDFGKMAQRVKSKKPTFTFIAIAFFAFSALLTMLCSQELNDLISYANFGIQILSAYLIARLLNFKRLVKIYQTGMLIICLVAIFFYIIQFAFGFTFTFFKPFVSYKGSVFYNYFYVAFQDATSKRVQGPFWEPGLLSTFVLIALAFEIVFYKKIRWLYVITFLIAIILSRSTFGYLLLFIILLFVVNKKIDNFVAICIFYAIIITSMILIFVFYQQIITFLADKLPEVFGKMIRWDGKIVLIDIDRLKSPEINFNIWLKSPIWGNGLQGADKLFAEAFPGHAQTSTMTFYLAQFGILGLGFTFFFFFGLWKIKSMEAENKIVFTLLFIVLMNKEPHAGIIFDWILLFLFLKEGWDKDTSELAFDAPSEGSIISSFGKKDDASVIKRNISLSFLIKGIALAIGFFSYPIYRKYFNNDSVLGIWLTVLSIMSMIISLDLGLGNGLKNNIIKAIVKGDEKLQKQLISSAYVSSFAISLLFLLVVSPIIAFSNLNSFFGVSEAVISPTILKLSSFLVCFSICLELSLKNVNSLLQAKQKQALSSIFALISTVLLMLFAVIYKSDNYNNLLLYISIAYVFTINIPLLVGTFIAFKTDYKGCFPSFKHVTKQTIRDITVLGLGFFIIQMLLVVLNSTNETFISGLFGSSSVVEYTNYYKPFSIVAQLFSLVTLPYWAMVAKEKEEHNISEIKNNIKKLFIFMGVFTIVLAFLSLIFQPFINLWLGEEAMVVNYYTVILFDVFIIEWMFISLLSVVANGLSIIKQQILFFAISAILKVSLCLFINLYKDQANWTLVIIYNIVSYVPVLIGETFIVIRSLKKLESEAVTDEK